MESTRTYLLLNGEWRLVLDPGNAGIREHWQETGGCGEALAVRVPSVWDLWVPDYDGVGWYFREFDVDAAWLERHVELCFEAADYYAEVWLNGIRLGDHEGGYTPFAFEVSKVLRGGSNSLAVRVIDPHGPEGFGDFNPKEFPCAKEHGYYSFAGLWGDVTLVAMERAHIQDVFIQPDVRRKLIVAHVEISAPGAVHLQIEGTPYHVAGGPGKHIIEFPDGEFWSPEEPRLHTLACRLVQEDGRYDAHAVRFGMREFSIKDNRFHLNNRPVFVKAALHQPDYARSLAAPEAPELARREIELAKAAGFNMLRMHIKTPPRMTLDLADELGMLIYEEPPIGWIKSSAFMQRRCEKEVREMVLRDRNHASVVIWGMLNETGNAGYVTGGGAQTIKTDLCRLAREIDPTRLIIDDSGGVNATREPARYLRPYKNELEEYDDLHIYQRAPVDRDIELYYQHNGAPDRLYFLSEFGFGGPEDLADVLAQYGENPDQFKDARFLKKMLEASLRGFAERGLDRIFGDFAGFCSAMRELQCDAARFQIDSIRINPKTAGYCYTQLCDAGHEFCAGILDRWRRPKPVFKTMQEVQRPLRPLIRIPRTNLAPREEAPVSILLANDGRIEGHAELSLQVVGPTQQVLWKKKRAFKLPRHGKEIWQGEIGASGSPGNHRFIVRVIQDGLIAAENGVDLYVLPPITPSEVEINVVDPQGAWRERCLRLAQAGTHTSPVHVVPPLANTIRGYPEDELARVLAQVEGGAVALFFGPPDDWNDLAERLGEGLGATPKDAVGAFLPVAHYVKLHPVFDGLPTRCLMRQPYRNVVPAKTFLEMGEEDICGSFNTAPIAAGNYMMDRTAWWGSDLLVRRFGEGRIVLTHLRVLEHLGNDPVADRLFVNLLNHFSRRSVPSSDRLPHDPRLADWLRNERANQVSKWMVLGEFPNWENSKGHDTEYPPEKEIDFDATYPGWYKAITWKPWFSTADGDHVVDLQAAFTPVFEYYPRFDHGTGYAYAEFSIDKRQELTARLGLQNATKVWLNGRLIHESKNQIPHDQFATDSERTYVRQGRNTLLVKCSKVPGPFRFSIHFETQGDVPVPIKWWR